MFTPGDIRRAIIAGVDLGLDAAERAYGAISRLKTLVFVQLFLVGTLLVLLGFFARDIYENRSLIERNASTIDTKSAYWDSLVEDVVDARLRIEALEKELEDYKEK